MAKDKRLGDDPFEKFLPQIQDSRKKKDNDVNIDNVNDSDNVKDKNNDTAKNINNDSDRNIARNNSRNNVRNIDNINIKDNVSVTDSNVATDNVNDVDVANISSNANDVNNADNDSNAVSNFINISKKHKKTDGYIRVSTYLLPAQVKSIEELQKKTGRDKGELYRMAVNILIERARVE